MVYVAKKKFCFGEGERRKSCWKKSYEDLHTQTVNWNQNESGNTIFMITGEKYQSDRNDVAQDKLVIRHLVRLPIVGSQVLTRNLLWKLTTTNFINLFFFFLSLQGAAYFHVQGSRVPHRPQNQEVMASSLICSCQRILLLRFLKSSIQNNICRRHQGL